MDGDNGKNRETKLAEIEEKYKMVLGPLYKDGGKVVNECCPNCKSTEKVMQSVYDYLMLIGKMPPGLTACSSTNRQLFVGDPRMQLVGSKIPCIIIYRDICRTCGLEYPVTMVREDTMLTSVTAGKK